MGTAYAALLLTLGVAYFVPLGVLLRFGIPLRLVLASLVVGLPILWAAFIFSDSFRRESRPAAAFGSNLLGVVVGGALEYTSNVWGLNALYPVAAALYLASAWFVFRGGRRDTASL